MWAWEEHRRHRDYADHHQGIDECSSIQAFRINNLSSPNACGGGIYFSAHPFFSHTFWWTPGCTVMRSFRFLFIRTTPQDSMSCWTNDFEHAVSFSRLEVQRSNGKKMFYISTTIASHQTFIWALVVSSCQPGSHITEYLWILEGRDRHRGCRVEFGHSEESDMAWLELNFGNLLCRVGYKKERLRRVGRVFYIPELWAGTDIEHC